MSEMPEVVSDHSIATVDEQVLYPVVPKYAEHFAYNAAAAILAMFRMVIVLAPGVFVARSYEFRNDTTQGQAPTQSAFKMWREATEPYRQELVQHSSGEDLDHDDIAMMRAIGALLNEQPDHALHATLPQWLPTIHPSLALDLKGERHHWRKRVIVEQQLIVTAIQRIESAERRMIEQLGAERAHTLRAFCAILKSAVDAIGEIESGQRSVAAKSLADAASQAIRRYRIIWQDLVVFPWDHEALRQASSPDRTMGVSAETTTTCGGTDSTEHAATTTKIAIPDPISNAALAERADLAPDTCSKAINRAMEKASIAKPMEWKRGKRKMLSHHLLSRIAPHVDTAKLRSALASFGFETDSEAK